MKLTETLTLTDVKGQYWLYDSTMGMNLAMRAATEQEAFVKALTYYQGRLQQVEEELKALKNLVESFVDAIQGDEE